MPIRQIFISNLRKTLLDELSSQNSNNVEDIAAELEYGFKVINENLEEVHGKLDTRKSP